VHDKIISIVLQEIHNDFMSKNTDLLFIESSMSPKALACLNWIESHGAIKVLIQHQFLRK